MENRLIQLTLHPQRYAWTVGFDRDGLIRSLFRPTFSPVSGLHETFRDQFKGDKCQEEGVGGAALISIP